MQGPLPRCFRQPTVTGIARNQPSSNTMISPHNWGAHRGSGTPTQTTRIMADSAPIVLPLLAVVRGRGITSSLIILITVVTAHPEALNRTPDMAPWTRMIAPTPATRDQASRIRATSIPNLLNPACKRTSPYLLSLRENFVLIVVN